MEEFKHYKIGQLKKFCKELGLRGFSKLSKSELVDLLIENRVEIQAPESDDDSSETCPHCGRSD